LRFRGIGQLGINSGEATIGYPGGDHAAPIHIQDTRLAQYMRLFCHVFSLPQWKYFVTVLLGLLHGDERRTLSALPRHVVVKVTIFGSCYFLRKAPWSVDELTAVHQARFYAQVAPLVAEAHVEQRAQRPPPTSSRPPARERRQPRRHVMKWPRRRWARLGWLR